MINTSLPKRLTIHLPMVPHEDVLNRAVQRVPDMQATGDIRWGHQYGETT
jgi:hypothetical protein